MPNGTIKFFNAAKGFGFITPDENGKEVFLPATSVTASGISGLKPGQRVSFEAQPDTKGPKAVDLKIIAPAHPPKPANSEPAPPARSEDAKRLTAYIDPESAAADDVLAELRRSGHEPVVVDYVANPPTKDELKRLSLLLRDSNQSLVRKYEPLFLELRLDDRFIGDAEFWSAIFEHPSLINGPVVATATRAGICHSKSDVKTFFAAPPAGGAQAPSKPKGLPPGLLRLVSGGASPPVVKEVAVEIPQEKAKLAAMPKLVLEVKPKVVVKPKATPKTEPRTAPKPAPKLAPKAAAKTKASPKKVASKPIKKPVRKAKK